MNAACRNVTATSGPGWAFGTGMPMGGASLQNPTRQLGNNVSFAQSLSGSQPATPLDPSYVPSLSFRPAISSSSSSLFSPLLLSFYWPRPTTGGNTSN